jgi:hypothetical protein
LSSSDIRCRLGNRLRFSPKPVEVDLVTVSRPLRITIEEEGRTRLKDRFVAGTDRRVPETDRAKVDPSQADRGHAGAGASPSIPGAAPSRSRRPGRSGGACRGDGKAKVSHDADYLAKRPPLTNLYARAPSPRSARPDLCRSGEGEGRAGRGKSRRRRRPRRPRTGQKHPQSFPRRGGTSPSPVGGSVFRLCRKAKAPLAQAIR